jgi:hypothetical protein
VIAGRDYDWPCDFVESATDPETHRPLRELSSVLGRAGFLQEFDIRIESAHLTVRRRTDPPLGAAAPARVVEGLGVDPSGGKAALITCPSQSPTRSVRAIVRPPDEPAVRSGCAGRSVTPGPAVLSGSHHENQPPLASSGETTMSRLLGLPPVVFGGSYLRCSPVLRGAGKLPGACTAYQNPGIA